MFHNIGESWDRIESEPLVTMAIDTLGIRIIIPKFGNSNPERRKF